MPSSSIVSLDIVINIKTLIVSSLSYNDNDPIMIMMTTI